VTEEAGDEALILREGDHAVAKVAGREHVEVAAKPATGAAVVGDGDDCSEVSDAGSGGGLGEEVSAVRDAEFEAAQEGREASTSADSDDAQARGRVRCRGYGAHRMGWGLPVKSNAIGASGKQEGLTSRGGSLR
jgi:hypothetical protein